MAAFPVGSTPYSTFSPSTSTSSSSSPAIAVGTSSPQSSDSRISLAKDPVTRSKAAQVMGEKAVLDKERQRERAALTNQYFTEEALPLEAQQLIKRIENRDGKLTDSIVSVLTGSTVVRLNQEAAIVVSEQQIRDKACIFVSDCQILFDSLLNLNNAREILENIEKIKLKERLEKLLQEIKALLKTNVNCFSMSIALYAMLYDGKLVLKDKENEIPQKNGQYLVAYERTATELLTHSRNRYEAILAAWTSREITTRFDDEFEDLDHLLKFLQMIREPSYCMSHKLTSELSSIMRLCEDVKDLINDIKSLKNSISTGTLPPISFILNIPISATDAVTGKETTKTVTLTRFKDQNFRVIDRSLKLQFGEGTFFLSDGKSILESYPGFETLGPQKQGLILEYIYSLSSSISFIPKDPNYARRSERRVVVANYRNNLRTSSAVHSTAIFHPASSVTSTAVYRPSPATPPSVHAGHGLPPAYSSASSVTSTAVYRPSPATPPSVHTGHGLPPAYSSASSVTATTRSLLPAATSSLASSLPAYNLASFLTSTADSSTSTAPYHTYTGHIQTRPLSSHTWTPMIHQSAQGAVASSMGIPVSHPSVTATLPSTSSFRSTPVPPAATIGVTTSFSQAQSSPEETEDFNYYFAKDKS